MYAVMSKEQKLLLYIRNLEYSQLSQPAQQIHIPQKHATTYEMKGSDIRFS